MNTLASKTGEKLNKLTRHASDKTHTHTNYLNLAEECEKMNLPNRNFLKQKNPYFDLQDDDISPQDESSGSNESKLSNQANYGEDNIYVEEGHPSNEIGSKKLKNVLESGQIFSFDTSLIGKKLAQS